MAAYPPPDPSNGTPALGLRLWRAALGYRHRVEERLDAAGFTDPRFPDGLILWLCLGDQDVTISQIGRLLGITRQSASKLVTGLTERGYVAVEKSGSDAREKVVRPTDRARARLAVSQQARQEIDEEIRRTLGEETLAALDLLLDMLAGPVPTDFGEILRDLRERHGGY